MISLEPSGRFILSLHSNMFLLIPSPGSTKASTRKPLHSNMFLLILTVPDENTRTSSNFTFQYVSINTSSNISTWLPTHVFTFQYVSINTVSGKHGRFAETTLHSNMFLLIRLCLQSKDLPRITLHSNMFLLILKAAMCDGKGTALYIPICFY